MIYHSNGNLIKEKVLSYLALLILYFSLILKFFKVHYNLLFIVEFHHHYFKKKTFTYV